MSSPLRIVPLGGLGEIGRNMLALDCAGDIILIDAGLMFPEQEMLGIDLVIPDISWLSAQKSRVRGICITHGHEDHVGALSFVLPHLNVPVYGTALSLALAKNKLKEHKLLGTTELHTVVPGDVVKFGSFSVEWIHTTHSVPDSCALAIKTPHGTVVHTGDFKLDQTPIHGTPPDLGRFAQLGEEGVLLLLSDSTNVETEGITPSEKTVGHGLSRIIDQAAGRVIVATFASNLGRVQQVLDIAGEADRKCFLAGRSMRNNVGTATELGYLHRGQADFLSPKQLDTANDADVVVLCTGSQGEPFSALTRIAAGEHPMLQVHEGDTVIISANPIPGNEEAVHRTINKLYQRGAKVFSGARHHVHASGHASREELKLMMALVKPKYFVPVHGEYRHLAIHAELARDVGIPAENVIPINSGTILEIDGSGARRASDRARTDYIYVDGLNVGHSDGQFLRDRHEMAHDGVIVVAATIDRKSRALVQGPEMITRGVADDPQTERLLADAQEHLRRIIRAGGNETDYTALQESIHRDLTKYLIKHSKRRPLIVPLITQV